MPMPEEGDPAPRLALPDEDGNPFDLKSLEGRRAAVFFYPRAATPG